MILLDSHFALVFYYHTQSNVYFVAFTMEMCKPRMELLYNPSIIVKASKL